MTRSRLVRVVVGCVILTILGPLGVPFAVAEDGGEARGAPAAYTVASAALTVAHVPSKVAMCGASVVLSAFAYLLTFGRPSVAKDAADTVKGVCGGPYIITPTQLRTDTTETYGTE